MTQAAYLRFPSVHADTITFVTDDDLWQVSAHGGAARRLTAGLSEPSTPCVSPDGRWLAFIGRDEHHPEVYVMPAEGGPARRLTWLGPDTQVRGFTPGGDILFVSTHGQPFFRNHRAFTISPEGGAPQLLPLGQVNHLAYGPATAAGQPIVIGRNTGDPARWKRYRGGTAGHLWVDATGGGQFRRMSELQGNITSPMWLGGRIYFLSDFEGVGNLYSCTADGADVQRHTAHTEFYARHAQSDGARIVYQHGADIWLFDPATNQTRRVDIQAAAHRTQAARKFAPVAEHITSMRMHPAGHSVALVTRGKLFGFALWEGAVLQHGGGAQPERWSHGQWLADGRTLVGVSDASSEEQVMVFEPDAHGNPPTEPRALPWNVGRVTTLLAAPRGTLVALANHRNETFIGDVASGVLTPVDRSAHGRSDDLAWSPDAQWLAYTFQASARHVAIKLFSVASGHATLVTQPEFRDFSPAFDPDGKHLYFLSLRTFDPVYDSVQFEMSFPRGARPYLIALQAGGAPPFDPAPRSLKPLRRSEEAAVDKDAGNGSDKSPDKASDKKDAPETRVDLPGIVQRIAPFPVPENRFGKLVAVAHGKVVWSVLGIVGAHGRGGHKEGPAKLEVFDFATARTETLAERADAFDLAADHSTLLLRDAKRLRVIDASKKPAPAKPGATDATTPSRENGWLDLGRVRLSVDPRAEWRQMFREVWRLQRDQFWVADMSGIDWAAMHDRYVPLIERVSTRSELSDLIWELQGELGTSHAYEIGGDHRKPPSVALGHLAAELRLNEADESYEITRIASGDAWDAGADSPLNAVGVEAKVGERITAVNGQRVSRSTPPQALLVHQANAKVELTLTEGEGAAATTRRVLVNTLADEVPAHYREWVEAKRAWVHAQSNGRVGYFHLPDMMAAGYAEFHRYFNAECDRDALIVDVRYNRGGHVSQLLLEKVARKRIGYALTRWGEPSPYPDESVAGPVVTLTNEHAGSDGDIFSHSFKLMKLGPLVGTRTWGGVVGIWPRHDLVDGSGTTQPEYAFWFSDVGFGVEGHGTDPQIEIDNAPHDAAGGHDRQLEVALQTALAEIGRVVAPGLPAFGPGPNRVVPPWPKGSA
jgi:tricorn protease